MLEHPELPADEEARRPADPTTVQVLSCLAVYKLQMAYVLGDDTKFTKCLYSDIFIASKLGDAVNRLLDYLVYLGSISED